MVWFFRYVVYLSDETSEFGKSVMGTRQLNLPNGGVYTVLLKDSGSSEEPWTRYDIVEPNSLNIFWQFPQYFVITLAEVFLSVSGLSFAYSEVWFILSLFGDSVFLDWWRIHFQAPESMKSVMQAAWLLTSAFGSIIVMVFSGAHLVPNQVSTPLRYWWTGAWRRRFEKRPTLLWVEETKQIHTSYKAKNFQTLRGDHKTFRTQNVTAVEVEIRRNVHSRPLTYY